MKTIRSLLVGCTLAAAAMYGTAALSAPQNGWWWNPAESGRGFFVESRDDVTFLGVYGYTSDGHATWLVAGGPNKDPYNYTGELYAMSNGQTLFGSYAPPVGPNYDGTISVHFSDDTHGTVTWPGGKVAIERQVFGGENEAPAPFSGWWWNPDESGSGYSIEIQGDNLFIVGFMYDTDGRPVWYYSAGTMKSSTAYQGNLLQFANGQTIGGPYRPPGTPLTVGTLDIEFSAADEATLTFTGVASAATAAARPTANPAPVRRSDQRPLLPTNFKFPDHYSGKFLLVEDIDQMHGRGTVTYSGDLPRLEILGPSGKPGVKLYRARAGTITVVVDFTVDGFDCHTSGVKYFTASDVILPEAVQLLVSAYGGYTLQFPFVPLHLTMPVTETCRNPYFGSSARTYDYELHLSKTFNGRVDNEVTSAPPDDEVRLPLKGSFYRTVGKGYYVFTAHYLP